MTPEDLELVIQGAAKVSDAAEQARRALRGSGARSPAGDALLQWEALLALASGVELLARRAQDEMARPPAVRPCPVCAEDEDLCPHRQARAVLALPMGRNDLDAATVREYLAFLLRKSWRNDRSEGPDPWLTYAWTSPVWEALAAGGMVPTPWTPEGDAAADALVDDVWRYLAAGG